jgi:hypothetical protein
VPGAETYEPARNQAAEDSNQPTKRSKVIDEIEESGADDGNRTLGRRSRLAVAELLEVAYTDNNSLVMALQKLR